MTAVGYAERAPAAILRPFLVCTWMREAACGVADTDRGESESGADRILPDGCIDIIWDGTAVFVAGPDTGPVVIDPGAGAPRYAGARFRPGAAVPFLSVPASELVDQRVPLDAVWGGAVTQRLSDRLASCRSLAGAGVELERALIARLDEPVDGLVAGAVGAIATDPSLPVAELASRLGVTDRTLHRRMRGAVGYGPKMLQRIARFRRFLALAPTHDELGLAGLANAAGYADQAHLTRECRALAGLTPRGLVDGADVRLVQDGLTPVAPGCDPMSTHEGVRP